jgi:outer membrane protein assembly factor BamB
MMWKVAREIVAMWAAFVALVGLTAAQTSTLPQLPSLTALWTYSTASHFTFYGALAGLTIYREEIRGTALRPDRVIFGLISPGQEHPRLRLICLDRRDGSEVWGRDLPGDVLPMSREFPTMNDRLFLALYDSTDHSVSVVAVEMTSGALLWQLNTGVPPNRYRSGDLFDVDPAKGVLHLYLPEASRDNRVTISFDGSRMNRATYRGYFWPTGARQHGNLVFAFDGEPLSGTAKAAVALDESTGQVRWRIPTAGHWTTPPLVRDDVLVIAAKTELQAFDLPSGRRRWAVILRGQVPPHPPPPMIVKDHIFLAQHLHGKLPPYADWIFASHLFAGGAETGVVRLGERLMGPTSMRRIGSVVVSESDLAIHVVDPAIPALHSVTSFEGTFSRFVFATPRVSLGSADDRGFLVSTSHGKLHYYSVPSPISATSRSR